MSWQIRKPEANLDLTPINYFKAGLFLILTLLHLTFYKGYRVKSPTSTSGFTVFLVAVIFYWSNQRCNISARFGQMHEAGDQRYLACSRYPISGCCLCLPYPNRKTSFQKGLALLAAGLWLLCFFQRN
ncbi:MAG: hypothetical protein U0X91_21710 [Spirosomataceae bacterium]